MEVRCGPRVAELAERDANEVMVEGQRIALSDIAAEIVALTSEAGRVSLTDITAHIVDTFGPPPPPADPSEVTRTMVLELIGHGILQDEASPAAEFTPNSVRALRDVLRHIVSQEATPWRLPAGVTGSEFVAAAERHRVVPALATALPRLAVPDVVAAQLRGRRDQEAATVAVLADELAGISRDLGRSGVRMIAFKGLALAVQAHGDVAARGTGDQDILVAPEDVATAFQSLTAQGWTPGIPLPSPGPSWAWRRLISHGYELPLSRPGSRVDLHWRLAYAHNEFPTFDALWQRRAWVSIGGEAVATLGKYDALAHSASHSGHDSWRWLRGLLDVRLLADDPDTWRAADRPLRPGQIATLGVALSLLGAPAGAPPVVEAAIRSSTREQALAVQRQQLPAFAPEPYPVPGRAYLEAFVSMHRAGASLADFRRHVSMSVVPPITLVDDPTPYALAAVPRVFWHRSKSVAHQWHRVLNTRLTGRQ